MILPFRRRVLMTLLKLSDGFILIVSLLLTAWLATRRVSHINLVDFLSIRISMINLIGLILMLWLWRIICRHFHLYQSRRLQSHVQEWKDIFKATTTATLLFFLGARLFNVSFFGPVFTVVFWLSSSLLTACFRSFLRYALKRVRLHGRNLRFILIVGTNQRAYDFARTIEENREFGYRVAGYVDDCLYVPKEGIRLLGGLKDFPNIIRSRVIDEVIIALPIKSQYESIQKTVEKAEEQGVRVRCLSHLFDRRAYAPATVVGQSLALVNMAPWPHEDARYLVKRTIDVVFGSVFLLLTLPVMFVVAVAMKLTSRGPVLFVQDRVGYNKRIFRLYKFRTMVMDAEKEQQKLETLNEMDGPVFKIRDDPRVTRVGYWLRKMSLDELPQLYNVVRGDMSLVGPRPLPLRDYNGFTKDWQRRRFSVRPGLTCLWQVNGRNHRSFEDWMKLDIEYIDNWSLYGDMKILLQTIPAVMTGRGAS